MTAGVFILGCGLFLFAALGIARLVVAMFKALLGDLS
jgi:hypothetical protein